MAKKSNGKSTPKPKHKGGRPTKLDPNVVQKLTAAFHNGFNIEEACSFSGIAKKTYYNWIEKNKRFLYEMEVAQQAVGKQSKKIIVENIQNGNWKAAAWWLERKQRKEFASRTELTGEDGEKLEVGIIVKPTKREKGFMDPTPGTPRGSSDSDRV
ncbi:MAG TPA: hypothetical protein PLV82_02340 [bacterium]|nr:hypothetical protein [bacterium]